MKQETNPITNQGHEANTMLAAILTKEQAIALMKQGKKLTHRYFSDDEWITMRGNMIVMENGCSCWNNLFWQDRQGEKWETDWSLYDS
jgi:hypothetical protein